MTNFEVKTIGMKNERSIIIIGAGMAGLSAGCYAQMNGFRTRIFEMNHRAGGVCQSWEREGYTVNGCIHWLVGSQGDNLFHKIWHELGAMQGCEFYNHHQLAQFEYPGYDPIIFYSDVQQLEKHLLTIAPEDKKQIQSLTHAIRVFSKYQLMPPEDTEGLGALLKSTSMLIKKFPLLREAMKWWNVTIGEFAENLKNPALKAAFSKFWHTDMSMVVFIMTMSFLNQQIAGYPMGGSSAFIRKIEKRYYDLGGGIQFDAEVAQILVRNGQAYGIRLSDGTEYTADYVISAADGYATVFKLLQGRFTDEHIQNHFKKMKLFPPLLFASFGINHAFQEIPSSVGGLMYSLKEPVRIGKQKVERLGFQIYNFDPALAPKGKTTLTTMLETDYDEWYKLYQDKEKYEAAKQEVLQQLVKGLEQRFPGISKQIEMMDLATPITFQTYTGNYRGSYEGWLPTPKALRTQMKKTLPGLDNFYRIGHWVEPGGGLPPSALSGRNVIKSICKKEKMHFLSFVAEDKMIKKEYI